MQMIGGDTSRYRVEAGEKVFVMFTKPHEGHATAVLGNKNLNDASNDEISVFMFNANFDGGAAETLRVEFRFAPNASPNDEFTLILVGSNGGLFNEFLSVRPDTPVKIWQFTFEL